MSTPRVTRSAISRLPEPREDPPPADLTLQVDLKRPRDPPATPTEEVRPAKKACTEGEQSRSNGEKASTHGARMAPRNDDGPEARTEGDQTPSDGMKASTHGGGKPPPYGTGAEARDDHPTTPDKWVPTDDADSSDDNDSRPPVDVAPDGARDGGKHPDFAGVNYVPYGDLTRAIAFAKKKDDANKRFGVSIVPGDAAWGCTPQTEKLLCIQGKPVTVWLVAKLRSKWFFNMNGEPQARVNVGFTLPYKGDNDGVKLLLQKSRPRKDEISDVIYASRFQSRQQKGETAATVVPFKNVYDAQKRFRAKNEMPLLPPAYLGPNDLVLIEAFLTRWKTAKDKKNRRAWTLWDVGFELQCISLLFDSPSGIDDDEPVVDGDIADDM